MENRTKSRYLVLAAFFAIYFVWGTTYLAGMFVLKSIPPFLISALRYLSAAALLGLYGCLARLRWPPLDELWALSISGVLMLVGGSGLVLLAQEHIGSGYAAAIMATEPLWFVLLDRSRWGFYFSNKPVLIGLLIGMAAVICFSLFTTHEGTVNGNHWLGTALLIMASISWVSGTLLANRKVKAQRSNITSSSVQLFAAALVAGLISFLRGEWPAFTFAMVTMESWAGLAYLVIFGSVICFLAFNWLVKVQPPAIVSTHTYVNPVVALFMGWLVANEQINWIQGIALAGVFAGVLMIQRNK
jgi:drug/metabolite transporter (DMT)-like permease